jgi:hypothetical protein
MTPGVFAPPPEEAGVLSEATWFMEDTFRL